MGEQEGSLKEKKDHKMVGGGEVKKQGWTEWEQMGLKRRGVKEEKRWSRQEECLCRYVHPAGPRLEVMEGGVWAEHVLPATL